MLYSCSIRQRLHEYQAMAQFRSDWHEQCSTKEHCDGLVEVQSSGNSIRSSPVQLVKGTAYHESWQELLLSNCTPTATVYCVDQWAGLRTARADYTTSYLRRAFTLGSVVDNLASSYKFVALQWGWKIWFKQRRIQLNHHSRSITRP